MDRRLLIRGLTAIAAVVVLAGCGSSGSSTAGPQTTATTTSTTTSTPATGATAVGTTTTPPAGAAAGIAQCKRVIEARPGLSAKVKGQLDVLCEKAASESPIEVRQAAEQVCVDLVNNSALPAGSAKSQALAACKTA